MTAKQQREYRREFARQGGKARARKLTPEQRSASARKAAQTRWQALREKRPKTNITDSKLLESLTESEWKELTITGCVIKGDRIIRTLSFIKRSEKGTRKEIQAAAKRLFA